MEPDVNVLVDVTQESVSPATSAFERMPFPAVILDESFLSFLGLGIQAPQSSWGSLLADGAEVINPIHSNWWLLVFPAIAMCVTVLALNFLGDAIREAVDPRARR